MAKGDLIERKYLGHFIDEAFDTTYATTSYVRLGEDLEEYSIEMNAETEEKTNILGETSFKVKGYKPQASVSTYYAKEGSVLYAKLKAIIDNRSTGAALNTSVVDVIMSVDESGNITAGEDTYREDVTVVPQSLGGGTDGVQIPFEIHYVGNRTKGTFDLKTKTFTAGAATQTTSE